MNIMKGRRGSLNRVLGNTHYHKSLNAVSRRKESTRVVDDNASLLKRLQSRKSQYNTSRASRETRSKVYLNTHEHSRHLPLIDKCKVSRSTRQRSVDLQDEFKDNVQVLSKTRKEVEKDVVDIELALSKGRMVIKGTSVNSLKEVVITVPLGKSTYICDRIGKEILGAFRHNYKLMLDKLQIVGGKLIIVAPTAEELERYSDFSQQFSVKECNEDA